MTISVEKLSLLGSLAPLRQTLSSKASQQDNGFAGKLDRALDSADATVSPATSKAKELAESLTLQMLQSSLNLAGDPPSAAAATVGMPPFSSTTALLEAYRANRSSAGEQAPAASPSQLQDFADAVPVAGTSAPTSKTHSDVSWLDPIISRASQKYGVDVGLIKAVIKAESDFNPQAVSHAGARGLMQLMPATARSLGVSDSFDPEQNVMAGTRFIKDLLQRYGGNVDSALAAYNWGPGNVDKHPGYLPRETRDYLARVKQLYSSYNG